MRLKVMNCKNCNAPLHLEDGRLVCSFCGSSFDIAKDADDIEYEKTVNAEAYILQSLTRETNELNEYYKRTEEQKLEQERAREEEEIIRRHQNLKKSIFRGIRMIVIITLISASIVLVVQLSLKKDEAKAERAKEARIAKAEQVLSSRVTRSDLVNSPGILDKISQMVLDYIDSEYDEKEKEDDDVIWVLDKDPEIISRYLMTTEDKSTVYSFVMAEFKTSDGRSRKVYSCVALDGITVDTKGNVSLDPDNEVYPVEASDHEYYWRGGSDRELLYDEVIRARRRDPEQPLLFYYEL